MSSSPSSSYSLDYLVEVQKGINLIWNNKFQEAEDFFASKKDQLPRFALHHAETVFLKSFITADVNDTVAAVNRLKNCRELAEKHIHSLEKGHLPHDESKKIAQPELINRLLDTRIVFGDALYMTAILQFTRDEKIKGAFNMRKSWKAFEKGLVSMKNTSEHVDPELKNSVKFGAGLFMFAMSIIPRKFLKLVELAGFKADRDTGLFYIKECRQAGGIRAPFATMLLLVNSLLLPRGLANPQQYINEAQTLINETLPLYPQGSLFQVMASHCARKQCDIDGGIKFMLEALKNCENLKQQPLIYKYELGNCYSMKAEWAKAAEQFQPLIKEEKFQVRVLCALQLAGCYMMNGQKEKCLNLLNELQSYQGKKSSIDSMSKRQAKRFMSNGGHFVAFEILYLRRDLAKMVPVMDQVLQQLNNIAPPHALQKKEPVAVNLSTSAKLSQKLSKLSPFGRKEEKQDFSFDDRVAYLLLKGYMLKNLNKNDEALELLKEALSLEANVSEKYYIPYACYELGECYFVKGDIVKAEELFKKCGKISGYDWEDPLKIRLRVTMDQLKKAKGETKEVKPQSLDELVDQTKTVAENVDESNIDKINEEDLKDDDE